MMLLIFCCLLALIHCQDTATGKDITVAQGWIYGMIASVGVIVLGAVNTSLIVLIQQCISVRAFKMVINLLYALGCGAMLGDVMVHTLPYNYENRDVKSEYVALLFILAILSFILLERAFMECGGTPPNWQITKDYMKKKQTNNIQQGQNQHQEEEQQRERTKQEEQQKMTLNDHFQSFHVSYKNMRKMLKARRMQSEAIPKIRAHLEVHNQKKKLEDDKKKQPSQVDICEINLITSGQKLNEAEREEKIQELEKGPKDRKKREEIPVTRQENIQEVDDEDDQKKGCIDRLRGKAPAGYLNVLNSFVHTIFDGFAIGAGFGYGKIDQYLPVIIAVYAHEVPRQMGDVGVLMKSRFTGCQSIFFNSSPNIGTIIGAVVALAIGQINEEFKIYVLSFAAGNLTFIAADIWMHLFKNKHWWGNALELLFFFLGVGIEYLLLLTEH